MSINNPKHILRHLKNLGIALAEMHEGIETAVIDLFDKIPE